MKNKTWYYLSFLLLVPFPALLALIVFDAEKNLPRWWLLSNSKDLYFWIALAMFAVGLILRFVLMVKEQNYQDIEQQRADHQFRMKQHEMAYNLGAAPNDVAD